MFDASCSQPTEDTGAACGIFAPNQAGTVDLTALTVEEFLSKLDLTEYTEAFAKAGITTVSGLARMTEAELDGFALRKLEKRKLVHHLNKAKGLGDDDNSMLCGAT
mmetsp:Transcript_10380/g.26360  ORF Transcript_10380/g.26360 Transcript_10380/m.26360 type:complete len:106 (+) Transcript_10380:54-371(+)